MIHITVRTPFRSYVRTFVRDVIRHRNVLMTRQLSATNKMKTVRIIAELTQANTLNYTDRGAAVFFLNREHDIYYLINQGDTVKLTRFRELLQEAQTFSKL